MREIYTLSSDDLSKMADWVAYRVTPASIGSSGDREWHADPWLSVDERLTLEAYAGANRTLHVDRGHQAPLASFFGTPFASETNVLFNLTPQASALNQGPWNALQAQERELARRLNVAVYVYTGPLFERLMAPLPSGPALQRVPRTSSSLERCLTPSSRHARDGFARPEPVTRRPLGHRPR